jgi:hypothetical protein
MSRNAALVSEIALTSNTDIELDMIDVKGYSKNLTIIPLIILLIAA